MKRRGPARTTSTAFQMHRCIRLARQFARQRRYEEALTVLGRAIAHTQSAELYDYRGVLHALMRKEQDALADYALALALAEKGTLQAQVLYHRGLLYGRQHSFDQALLDMEQAQRLDPANALYREAVGQIRVERSLAFGTDTGPAATVPES